MLILKFANVILKHLRGIGIVLFILNFLYLIDSLIRGYYSSAIINMLGLLFCVQIIIDSKKYKSEK